MGRILLADLPPREQERLLAILAPRPLSPFNRTSPVDLAGILRQTRENGYALVEQELEVGLRSMAVPLRDPRGTLVAAVNLALHAGPDTPGRSRERLLPHLRATATDVEADLAAVFAFAPVHVE
ncbi:IclR family transcriptional regulator C-terminal domain-containing protein [Streptomyces cacaoi]|uniref:IclR family transcriptional regulator domain-containing protein n=1 Tax=Streptomyces cacaoi TaxID=1898 RepID=UPI003748709E